MSRRGASTRGNVCAIDAAEQRHGGRRHQDAGRAAEQSEHGGLDEQLAAQAPGCRADGGAHRELASAMAGAREQQIGDIRAGDEQHQPDGAEHREHNRPRVADEIVFDRQHPERPARRVRVVLTAQRVRQRVKRGRHLGHVDPVTHAADHVEVLTAAVGAIAPAVKAIGTHASA